MRKPLKQGILIGLLLIGISLACSLPITQIIQPETETPTPTATINRPTKTNTALPTDITVETATPESVVIITPATPTPKFAPFCEQSSANVLTPTPFQCYPIAEQSSLFCSSKIPYNLIEMNEGSTYEVLNEEVTCSDAGKKDGKQLLTCTGPMAFSFEVRVCDPACAIPTFRAATTNCPQNYDYNELLNCCEQRPQPIDQNCVVLKLQVKNCVVACDEFTETKTCDKNGSACYWNFETDTCQQRPIK